ncbi:MAG TPA: hypothetical protein VFZ26_07950 [Gemmatimonadales bacterium]
MRTRGLLLLLLSLGGPSPMWAQAPAYSAAQLDCARFRESVRSRIETETAGRIRRAVAEREAVWSFRARDSSGAIALEGWFDSLAVRHGSGDTLSAPDTDGIIGGRYRGQLTPAGRYRGVAAPFVPDEVAEAMDAAAAMDDLFPPLPPAPLGPGARWTDGAGFEIERLPDSASAGLGLQRYALRRRTETAEALPRGDTVPLPLRQTSVDQGRIVWHPTLGLLRRERETVIDAVLPAGGRVRSPVRSRVVQHAELTRLSLSSPCPPGTPSRAGQYGVLEDHITREGEDPCGTTGVSRRSCVSPRRSRRAIRTRGRDREAISGWSRCGWCRRPATSPPR